MGSFAEFSKGSEAGLTLNGDLDLYNAENREIESILEKRKERRRKLLIENLPLLFRHRKEILSNDDYANVQIDFLFRKPYGFPDSFPCSLSIAELFNFWNLELVQSTCSCGSLAVLISFAGSPMTGSYRATCACTCCGNSLHVGAFDDQCKLKASASYLTLLKAFINAAKESSKHLYSKVQVETLINDLRHAELKDKEL